jgi:hypothetical protein
MGREESRQAVIAIVLEGNLMLNHVSPGRGIRFQLVVCVTDDHLGVGDGFVEHSMSFDNSTRLVGL